MSSVSGVQGGGSVAYVSRPLSALPIATLYKGSASIHKDSKTEMLFCARPLWTYQDKETLDDTNLDDITLPNGRFIPVISEFRYLGSYITRDGTDTKDSERGSTLLLVHLEHYQSEIFNRDTSNVMPNALCMKD